MTSKSIWFGINWGPAGVAELVVILANFIVWGIMLRPFDSADASSNKLEMLLNGQGNYAKYRTSVWQSFFGGLVGNYWSTSNPES